MGRIFEVRKNKMFARYAKMARVFTKIGKEIAIAVKSAGSDPKTNPKLRMILAKARSLNVPKANLDAAIKRAISKEDGDLQEILYEGKGPHGIGMMIEAATNNPVRTVANIRTYFSKCGGVLGSPGSMTFLFNHVGQYKIAIPEGDLEAFEFELIDFGAEEFNKEEDALYITTSFDDYGKMQKALEDKGCTILHAELIYEPHNAIELSDDQVAEVQRLVEMLEDDDDVTSVYTALA